MKYIGIDPALGKNMTTYKIAVLAESEFHNQAKRWISIKTKMTRKRYRAMLRTF